MDIESTSRFRKLTYKQNMHFYKSLFTPGEIKYCLSKADPSQHFAARFCAKEAVIKALKSRKLACRDIEIISRGNAPSVKIRQNPRLCVQISMSHTRSTAIAFAII